jgi:hypothetical protein
MDLIANRHAQAAKMLMDKLGGPGQYTVDVYYAKDCSELVKIDENSEEYGKFFVEENYVIDIKSKEENAYRYIVSWHGPQGAGERLSKVSDLITYQLQGGVMLSSTSVTQMRVGSEIPTMLQFFKKGFIVLNGPYQNFSDCILNLKEKGVMIRVQDGKGF